MPRLLTLCPLLEGRRALRVCAQKHAICKHPIATCVQITHHIPRAFPDGSSPKRHLEVYASRVFRIHLVFDRKYLAQHMSGIHETRLVVDTFRLLIGHVLERTPGIVWGSL